MPLPCLTFDYQRVVAGMSIMKAATEPTGFRMGCCTWPPLFFELSSHLRKMRKMFPHEPFKTLRGWFEELY